MYLQSSPTGPAEHCAGGSLCRSVNSCKQKKKYSDSFTVFISSILTILSRSFLLEFEKLYHIDYPGLGG